MPSRNVVSAGNKAGFGGFCDDEGFLIGKTPTAPTAGTSTNGGMFRVIGIKRATPTTPEPESVIASWDDDTFTEFQFNSIQPRRFLVDVAIEDLDTWGYILNMPVNSLGSMDISYQDRADAPQYNMCFLFQSRAKKERAADAGQKAWSGIFIHNATAAVLGRVEYNERTVAIYRLSITPVMTTHNLWGSTIYDRDSVITPAIYSPFESDYPVTVHRSTGALAIIPVDYQPASAAQTFSLTERVNNTISSVSTSGKTITITPTPGPSGARTETAYQFTSA